MRGAGEEGAVQDLVSVIVPCYNKAEFVGEALASVLAQADVPLEVIVVDDASTDASWAEVAPFTADERVTAQRLPENRGSTYTRNFGAELARGGYLMFLDADDVLGPGTLAALRTAARDLDDGVAACRWLKLHREGDRWVPKRSGKPLHAPGGDYVEAWLAGWYFPPCSVLWPRAVFDRSEGWGEMGPWDDADIMMRMLLQGNRIVVADGGEAMYRILDEGDSLRSLPTEAAVRSRIRVLHNVRRHAESHGVIDRYRRNLGEAYYDLAWTFAAPYPDLVLECYREVDRHLGRRPIQGSALHRALWIVLGLERKERLARWLARQRLVRRGAGSAADTGG